MYRRPTMSIIRNRGRFWTDLRIDSKENTTPNIAKLKGFELLRSSFVFSSNEVEGDFSPNSKKFGRGTRELTGALDLITFTNYCLTMLSSWYNLITHYLYIVVGDTEIRKVEGMQLNQLIQDNFSRDSTSRIKPFDLSLLGNAFQLSDATSVDLPHIRNLPTGGSH